MPLLVAPGRHRPAGDGRGHRWPSPSSSPTRPARPPAGGSAGGGAEGRSQPGPRGRAGGRWRLAPARRAARGAARRHAGGDRHARNRWRAAPPARPGRRPAGARSGRRDRRRRCRPPRQHRDADPRARRPARAGAGADARARRPQRRAAPGSEPRRQATRAGPASGPAAGRERSAAARAHRLRLGDGLARRCPKDEIDRILNPAPQPGAAARAAGGSRAGAGKLRAKRS